jgi:hypothetical protein
MVHEEAADEIVLVPESREEEEARILDAPAASTKSVAPIACRPPPARASVARVTASPPGGTSSVATVACRSMVTFVACSSATRAPPREHVRRAEALDGGHHAPAVERQRRETRGHAVLEAEGRAGDAAAPERARVERGEVGGGQRPAAVWDAGARLEVDLVQGHEAAAAAVARHPYVPDVRRAAELPPARVPGREEVAVRAEPSEAVRPRIGGEPARLDDADAPRAAGQLERDREAGRPRADDAHLARGVRAVLELARVDEHAPIYCDPRTGVERR